MKWVFKRQAMQMLCQKLLQIWVIFIHLKLYLATATHNFKFNFSRVNVTTQQTRDVDSMLF